MIFLLAIVFGFHAALTYAAVVVLLHLALVFVLHKGDTEAESLGRATSNGHPLAPGGPTGMPYPLLVNVLKWGFSPATQTRPDVLNRKAG